MHFWLCTATWGLVTGYVLIAFAYFSVFAPLYCSFLFINRARIDNLPRLAQTNASGAGPRKANFPKRVFPSHYPFRRILRKYTRATKSYTAWVIIGVKRLPVQIHSNPRYAPMNAAMMA